MESLSQLLPRYQRHPSQALAAQIFAALAQAQVYVPVNLGRNQDAPVQQEDAFGLKPDTIPGPDGSVLFPAFSNQGQIPNAYGARFSFAHLPFPAFCTAACAHPQFGGLVLDPFTAKFILPADLVRQLADSAQGLQ